MSDDDSLVARQILRGRFERFTLSQTPVPLLISKAEDAAIRAALDARMRARELEPALVIAWGAGRLPEAVLRDYLGFSAAAIAKSESRARARLGRRPAGVDDAIEKGARDPDDREFAKSLAALRRAREALEDHLD